MAGVLKVEVFEAKNVTLRHPGKLTSLYVGMEVESVFKKTKSHTTTDGSLSFREVHEFSHKEAPPQLILTVSERHRTSEDVEIGRSVLAVPQEPGTATIGVHCAGGTVQLGLTSGGGGAAPTAFTPPPASAVSAPVAPSAAPAAPAPAPSLPQNPAATPGRGPNGRPLVGTLHILQMSATGLLALDKKAFGPDSSDPLLKVSVGGQTNKTDHISKTLDPVWKEQMEFKGLDPGANVHLQVFDHDTIGKDDALGECYMPLPVTDQHEMVSRIGLLNSAGMKKNAKGEVILRYNLIYKEAEAPPPAPVAAPVAETRAEPPARSAPAAPAPAAAPANPPAGGEKRREDKGRVVGSIVVSKISAAGLRAADKALFKKPSSDPYAQVSVLSGSGAILSSFKTDVLQKNLCPTWEPHEKMALHESAASIRVKFWDHDKGPAQNPDPLGFIVFPIPAESGEPTVTQSLQTEAGSKPAQGKGTVEFIVQRQAAGAAEGAPGAPVGVNANFSGAAFGKLIIKNMSARGLRAADRSMFGGGNSDPYVKIVSITPLGTVEAQTRSIRGTCDPRWEESLEVDLYERGGEVLVEVFDEDVGSGDDSLGMYSFDLPAYSCSEDVKSNLVTAPNTKQAQGSLDFSFTVFYDDEQEWRTSFLNIPLKRKNEKKKKAPKFSLSVTRNSITQITQILAPLAGVATPIVDILHWKNKPKSAFVYFLFTLICYYSLFFQAFMASFVFLFWSTKQMKGKPARKAPVAAGPAAAAPPADGPGFGLGNITALLFTTAYWLEFATDLLMWKVPARTTPIFYATIGGVLVSFLIPVRFLVWVVGTYIFTLESYYAKYPLFRQRFPPGRLAQVAIAKILTKVGMESKIPKPKQFRARLDLTVVKATGLRNADAGGFMAGKSDPFVRVLVRDQEQTTKAIQNTLDPEWNESLSSFNLKRKGTQVRLQVWDEDDGRWNDDEFLGEASFTVDGACGETETLLDLKPRAGVSDDLYITGQISVRYSVHEIKPTQQAVEAKKSK